MEKELEELKERVNNLKNFNKKIDESLGSITDLNKKTVETFKSITKRIDRLEDKFSKEFSISLTLNLAHLKQLIKYVTLDMNSEEKEHFFNEIWEDFAKSVKSVRPNVTRKELMTMKKTWDNFRKDCVKILK
jgi:pantothenate kinase-related protein Tda10